MKKNNDYFMININIETRNNLLSDLKQKIAKKKGW